ncbi:MAG: OmpA family protein [Rhodospirillaceae bacterium]|nr:OmpA family protein [Rhodospirillaceae bacterium]
MRPGVYARGNAKLPHRKEFEMKRLASLAAIAALSIGCSTPPKQSEFVGARGETGATGSVGVQGDRGPRGESGYAMAGPRGEAGPAGVAGAQGPTGATGSQGGVMIGARGDTGATGASGAQGQTGAAGTQGYEMQTASTAPAGPRGPAGPAGPRGEIGDTGARGATLVGPAGSAGESGATGTQGEVGRTGQQGMLLAGRTGEAGPAGAAGPQGPVGQTGAQGAVGAIEGWSSYRDFEFARNSADLRSASGATFEEIAAYMSQNPSLNLGIDGSMDPSGTDPRNRKLADQRVLAVRDALIDAGVPEWRIQIGAFGDRNLRRDRRVEVLVTSR